jgi:hypothetical protein
MSGVRYVYWQNGGLWVVYLEEFPDYMTQGESFEDLQEHLRDLYRALVTLAERGVRAEQDAKENLRTGYRKFLKEQEPSKKEEAGRDLIRAVFGRDAIAEDPIL